jgi:hypothetical protein
LAINIRQKNRQKIAQKGISTQNMYSSNYVLREQLSKVFFTPETIQ